MPVTANNLPNKKDANISDKSKEDRKNIEKLGAINV